MQDRNVSDAIYPPEDYRGYERQDVQGDYELPTTPEGPPILYVDALPVKDVAADDTIMRTIAVVSQGNTAGTVCVPVEIVPAAGNNQRRRALIVTSTNAIALVASDSPVILMSTSLGILAPSGFHLPVTTFYEYTGAAPVYAIGRGAAAAFSFVSVLVDVYNTDHE
jgi:hypothetical protein